MFIYSHNTEAKPSECLFAQPPLHLAYKIIKIKHQALKHIVYKLFRISSVLTAFGTKCLQKNVCECLSVGCAKPFTLPHPAIASVQCLTFDGMVSVCWVVNYGHIWMLVCSLYHRSFPHSYVPGTCCAFLVKTNCQENTPFRCGALIRAELLN